MTLEDLQQWIMLHPNGEPLLLPNGGVIHQSAALDLFREGPLEVIDILKEKK